MLIDCETCTVREVACGDCVVTHLLESPRDIGVDPTPLSLEPAEADAIAVLAEHGLVPPLRLAHGS